MLFGPTNTDINWKVFSFIAQICNNLEYAEKADNKMYL